MVRVAFALYAQGPFVTRAWSLPLETALQHPGFTSAEVDPYSFQLYQTESSQRRAEQRFIIAPLPLDTTPRGAGTTLLDDRESCVSEQTMDSGLLYVRFWL